MTRRRLLVLLTLALAGYAALFLFFPRYSGAARWGYRLDRASAIAKAREAAARFGVAAAGWKAFATTTYDRQIEYYFTRQPNPIVASLLSPITNSVWLISPRGDRSFRVYLNSRGEVMKIVRREPEPPAKAEAPSAGVEDEEPQARRAAEAALQLLLGDGQARFSSLAVTGNAKEGRTFTWTAALPDEPRVKLTAEALVKGTTVKEVGLKHSFAPQFQAEYDARRDRTLKWLSNIGNIIGLPAIVLGLVFYFVGIVRREIQHRSALIFLVVAFLFLVVTKGLSSYLESLQGNLRVSGPSPPWLTALLPVLVFSLNLLIFALALYAFWAAGQALAGRMANRRTVGLELLLRGQLHTRYVASSVAAGLLLGGLVGAIPYVVSSLFPGAETNALGFEDLFAAPVPGIGGVATAEIFSIFLLFSLIVPLVDVYVPRLWLARILILLIGSFWFTADDYFHLSAAAAFTSALLMVLAYQAIYRRFDFLAVIIAAMAAHTADGAAALFSQPSASLHASAMRVLIVLGVLLVVALVGVWKGREAPKEAFDPLHQVDSRAERERLKAEFGVARRAQEQMLPASPPELPGYEIAATCRPSKEVGGDLYDFIPLSDGRLGIVVADVSGKGVPAALYMTLTKGLLASVSEEMSDPGEILREVNRHLYAACRRKVFVTLFFGVIEPATRTLVYSRAGHNPPVWRNAADRTTSMLRASGLGLGLNAGQLFDRSLAVERIQLGPQDALFFYSDGITEAMNAQGEEYGEERLIATAARTDGLGAEATRDAVLTDVGAFLGQVPPQDDMTLVVVRVASGSW